MATHSSILAWRIPGMEEPDGLPSMGLQRVGHDWSDAAAAAYLPSTIIDTQELFKKMCSMNKLFFTWNRVPKTCQHCILQLYPTATQMGFPGGTSDKEPACQCKRHSLIPGWGRSPGGGNSNPLQYSCLENPMDRGAWPATVHGVAESWSWLKQLSTQARHINTSTGFSHIAL